MPIVSTDCGGPKDIIIQETGILVKPNSIESLTLGIEQAINNISSYNANNIRKHAIEKFGKQNYINKIKDILEKIIR